MEALAIEDTWNNSIVGGCCSMFGVSGSVINPQQERKVSEKSLGSTGSSPEGSVAHFVSASCPIKSKPREMRANRKDAPDFGS